MRRLTLAVIFSIVSLFMVGCIVTINLNLTDRGQPFVTFDSIKGPEEDLGETPTASAETEPEPADVTTVHIISTEIIEEEAGIQIAYLVDSQQFRTNSLGITMALSDTHLSDAFPLLALSRSVSDTTNPPLLFEDETNASWIVYVQSDANPPEITCEERPGSYLQELFVEIGLDKDVAAAAAYTLPVSTVCFIPANSTTQSLISHASDNQEWIDLVLFEIVDEAGEHERVLYRFVGDPNPPAGEQPCRTFCKQFTCSRALGCFAQRICHQVCR